MQIDSNILSQRDYEKLCRTPKEVCQLIGTDLKIKGITRTAAAEKMGVSRQVVTSQLAGKRYFSDKTSARYADTFGYNVRFLKSGLGYLNIDPTLDAKIYRIKPMLARTKSVSSSYIKYKDLHIQLIDTTKEKEKLEKEKNKLQKDLEAEKARNAKLLLRIERLTDKLEAIPSFCR